MATPLSEGLFSDEVFTSTELNRHGGKILDQASRHPVTISRNNEQFALLRREHAARLFRTVDRMGQAHALLAEAHLALAGETPSPSFDWLSVYEKDDLEKLVSEVFAAVRRAMSNSDWEFVEAVIHEWRESAIVAQTGVLDIARYYDQADETVLQHPDEILRSEAGTADSESCATPAE